MQKQIYMLPFTIIIDPTRLSEALELAAPLVEKGFMHSSGVLLCMTTAGIRKVSDLLEIPEYRMAFENMGSSGKIDLFTAQASLLSMAHHVESGTPDNITYIEFDKQTRNGSE